MSSCPFYNDCNLAFTGSKTDNPYAVIQNAGKKYRRKSFKKYKKTNKKTTHQKKRSLRKTHRRRKR